MPEPATWLAFVAATLAMHMVPGPDTLLVAARAAGQGLRAALWTVLGMTAVAGLIQVPLLALGIAAVADAFPFALDLLRSAGAAYLVWMGVWLLLPHVRETPSAAPHQRREAVSALAALRDGAAVNLLNPNPMVFMLAFLPNFVDPARGSVATQLLILGATQKALGAVVLGATALAAGAKLGRRPGFALWQERVAAGVMIGIGLYLLLKSVLGGMAAR